MINFLVNVEIVDETLSPESQCIIISLLGKSYSHLSGLKVKKLSKIATNTSETQRRYRQTSFHYTNSFLKKI